MNESAQELRDRADAIEGGELIRLLRILDDSALRLADGHVTIMRFTTGWKVMFATPGMEMSEREMLRKEKIHPSMIEAVKDALEPGGWKQNFSSSIQ